MKKLQTSDKVRDCMVNKPRARNNAKALTQTWLGNLSLFKYYPLHLLFLLPPFFPIHFFLLSLL